MSLPADAAVRKVLTACAGYLGARDWQAATLHADGARSAAQAAYDACYLLTSQVRMPEPLYSLDQSGEWLGPPPPPVVADVADFSTRVSQALDQTRTAYRDYDRKRRAARQVWLKRQKQPPPPFVRGNGFRAAQQLWEDVAAIIAPEVEEDAETPQPE